MPCRHQSTVPAPPAARAPAGLLLCCAAIVFLGCDAPMVGSRGGAGGNGGTSAGGDGGAGAPKGGRDGGGMDVRFMVPDAGGPGGAGGSSPAPAPTPGGQ